MTSKKPQQRRADHSIEPLILNRRSQRAMSGEAVTEQELNQLFEAARWAPSCFNAQPWKIFYARHGDAHWQNYFDLLVEFNQDWCKNAGCLLVIASDTLFPRNQKFSATHAFDCGAAWQNLALQGAAMNLVVHAMAGFDYEAAHALLNMPENYQVQAMVAVGYPGDIEQLDESLHEDELTPSNRNKTETFVFNGNYQA